MINFEMTNHAAVRKQQRGISADALECLLQFGKVSHDNRGGEVIRADSDVKGDKVVFVSDEPLDIEEWLEVMT